MSRNRSFVFNLNVINGNTENEWNRICKLDKNSICEYLFICKNLTSINGFIRFTNPKCLTTVVKLFNKSTELEIKTKNDKHYKDLFLKDSDQVFESENILKTNKTMRKKLELKDKIINEMVIQHKDELLEEKDKIINYLVKNQDQINEFVNTFKDCKENDSEQIKHITNLCMTIAKNTPTTITNTNNITNNNFNLNFFLNEYCKNAVNLIDFAKSIQIELQDVLLYKNIGHAEAVSQIFDKAYKNLELKMRPVHCTDVKRETLYVRNEDKWMNDETKELSEKAMDIISENSFKQLKKWKEANSDYTVNEEKKQEYTILMKNVIGGSSDGEMTANTKKILKNLSKNTQINKENILYSSN